MLFMKFQENRNENYIKIRDIQNSKYLDCLKYYRKDRDMIKKAICLFNLVLFNRN